MSSETSETSHTSEIRSPSGHPVLVGRNARENSRITAGMAGSHLWFHVRDAPGAHVVLQLPKGATATSADLACCERLARGRRPDSTAVTCCRATDVVTDARRGPPGLARVGRLEVRASTWAAAL
jgi:hypothetical protein